MSFEKIMDQVSYPSPPQHQRVAWWPFVLVGIFIVATIVFVVLYLTKKTKIIDGSTCKEGDTCIGGTCNDGKCVADIISCQSANGQVKPSCTDGKCTVTCPGNDCSKCDTDCSKCDTDCSKCNGNNVNCTDSVCNADCPKCPANDCSKCDPDCTKCPQPGSDCSTCSGDSMTSCSTKNCTTASDWSKLDCPKNCKEPLMCPRGWSGQVPSLSFTPFADDRVCYTALNITGDKSRELCQSHGWTWDETAPSTKYVCCQDSNNPACKS